MKKWIYIIIILAVLFFVIGFLNEQGYLNVKWQWLAVAISLLSGPYKLVMNWIRGQGKGSSDIKDILAKNEQTKKEEQVHRVEYDKQIDEKKTKIDELQKDIDLLDTKIQLLEEKKKNIDKNVDGMNINETKNAFNEIYGNEIYG